MLHQETDGRAVRAAAEAVIELLGRADGKRRAFLVMKRAQPHEIRAAFLQLDKTSHHVDDIDAVQQVLEKSMWNHKSGPGRRGVIGD